MGGDGSVTILSVHFCSGLYKTCNLDACFGLISISFFT